MKNFFRKNIRGEEKDIKDIWNRIKKRDFSGNMGLAVKNSVYQFSTQIVAKLGSLIFIVILARLLLPELFGLYSLALSTILIFSAIAELGVGQTIIRFVSREFGKKKGKIRSYLSYLGKIKIILVLFSAVLLLISANYIAHNFYQKPIFLALLAGILYIIFIQAIGFFQSLLQASNSFKGVFQKEIIFQISRVILVPLVVVFAIKYSFSDEVNLMFVILFLALSLFLTSLFLFFKVKKLYFKKSKKTKKLSKKQTRKINKFVIATATLVLSGVFFGNIDRIMLGHFVKAEFIGYYTAAFSLIGALTPLIGFAAIVLLPIFSRLKGKRLEAGFKKSIRITTFFSTAGFLVTIALAYFVILIIYGNEYLLAVNVLRILSLLLFVIPIIAIYQSYYLSQGKPGKVAKLLVITTLVNIILNYFLIVYMLQFGQLQAVYGAAIATIISKFVFLGGLVFKHK